MPLGWIRSVAALALTLTLLSPAMAQAPGSKLEDLGNGLYAFQFGPYRTIFLVSDEGIIAFDPLNAKAAAAARAEMRRITDQPVRYVLYSHSHWDHATGGQIYKDEGANFVGQERCLANMKETPKADVIWPDITYKDHYKLTLGKTRQQTAEAFYFGPSHDDCLVVFLIRPANKLFVVDIANPPGGWTMEFNPVESDVYMWNLVNYLRQVEELARRENITTFIGGHISTMRDASGRMTLAPTEGPVSAGVTEKREMWETLIGAVRTGMAEGIDASEIPAKLDRSGFKDRIVGYDDYHMGILLRRIASYILSGR
jgi:glyoxylase-like metal-dependent hydrolase (beta-lactamase superfamily II)